VNTSKGILERTDDRASIDTFMNHDNMNMKATFHPYVEATYNSNARHRPPYPILQPLTVPFGHRRRIMT
jgi:hypothetical protein